MSFNFFKKQFKKIFFRYLFMIIFSARQKVH